MEFKDGEIEGVGIREVRYFGDDRGWLTELFRQDDLEAGIHPVMSYASMTRPGVTRGPHAHHEQTDYFAFISSTFKLVLWDSRTSSPTYMNRKVLLLGEENPACVMVPPGVVHAYKNVGPREGLVLNFPNRLYAGRGRKESVDEIRYEDDPDTLYRVED